MADINISQINGTNAVSPADMLGTKFNKVELEGLKMDVEQLRKAFSFKGLERINALVEQTKKISTQDMSEKAKQNLQDLIEKLKKAAERFGIRLELDNTRVGDPLIRVYNRINNAQLTTIPLQVLLRMLVTVKTPNGTKAAGTMGQQFSPELIDTAAQDLADEISRTSNTNIIV